VVGVVDHHFYGRLRNNRPSGLSLSSMNNRNIWTRIQHDSIGGVTKYTALFCASIEIDATVSTLRRTLHHIMDHSIRPQCIRDGDP
jgi:hypothetical protein